MSHQVVQPASASSSSSREHGAEKSAPAEKSAGAENQRALNSSHRRHTTTMKTKKNVNPDVAAKNANRQPSNLETGGIKAARQAAAKLTERNTALVSVEPERVEQIKAFHRGAPADVAEWCYLWRTFNVFRLVNNPTTGEAYTSLTEWFGVRFLATGAAEITDRDIKSMRNTFDYLARRYAATVDAKKGGGKTTTPPLERAVKYLLGGKTPLFAQLNLTEQEKLLVKLNTSYEAARKAARKAAPKAAPRAKVLKAA